ncbi:hypothetical protein cce_3152 [Crocosphaera subtropica ATCC 51142]|uniref:PEP-CTERM protein-sorting domain-containing protein n=1 Tax=Crocosphaera subtropica (strain ATCC 51142 / BH68) TaxID=43989 RepID=B1WXF9_CROS5|nr:hypothetical protein cce_3152 [Crocosphaera subtropica ATCC 51142]
MSKKILIKKNYKSIPSILSFAAIVLASNPASAELLIEPFELLNIKTDANEPSEISSIDPSASPFVNGGNLNSSNSNNNGLFSPFASSSTAGRSSNSNSNNGDGDANDDSNSNGNNSGTETNDIISSDFSDSPTDLMTVASMLQPNGNNPDGPNTDNPGGDDPGTPTPDPTPIPESTSVTALAIIGLVGLLTKRNQDRCS